MASVHTASFGAVNATTGPSEDELFKLHQYDKIVQLRDAILAGTHPRIKLPPGVGPLATDFKSAEAPVSSGVKASLSQNLQSYSSNTQKPAGRPEINPIFLEKSDGLIRAELHLQRQRLERALKEEVEQRRIAKNTQAEPIPEFDLSDVLAKALTLVQATATVADPLTTTNNEAASDSFDDNTFYSSRHDTPESHLTSRIRNESEEERAPVAADPQQSTTQNAAPAGAIPAQAARVPTQPYQSSHNAPTNAPPAFLGAGLVPGLNNYTDGMVSTGPSQITSGEQSQSEDSGNVLPAPQGRGIAGDTRQHPRDDYAYAEAHPPSPIVRAHNLQPVAPQPSQISSLATARRLPNVADPSFLQAVPATAALAQVAALRNDPGVNTSPESSLQGGTGSDKKKGKKKKNKRKADRQAPEVERVPYIKAEPRSPSPLGNVSHIRPNKRARHGQQPAEEPGYQPPRFELAVANAPQEHHAERPYVEQRVPAAYVGGSAYPHPQRPASTAGPRDPRYGREHLDEGRLPAERYVRPDESPVVVEPVERYIRPDPSPVVAAYPYGSDRTHLERPSSRFILSDPYAPPPHPHRDAYEPSRMTPRPESDFYTAIPRPHQRILVDAAGREYIEPPRPIYRQSVAPSMRPNETEVLYERAPPRTVSRHPGGASYEEGNVVYARPSPPYAMPRRVVTQPEYVSQEYRDSRQREYSTRPIAPHGEYVQVMAPPERRQEEVPREYITRTASVRPAEPMRYAAPEYARLQGSRPEVPLGEYAAPEYARLQSARLEAPVREYAASVRPESRREMAQPYAMAYGGPVEQPVVRGEYSVRPVERYYEPQRAGETAYVEGPRAAPQDVVYADDPRRQVYR